MQKKNIILIGSVFIILIILGMLIMKNNSRHKNAKSQYRIMFLHHSTGEVIKNGGITPIRYIHRFVKLGSPISKWFKEYNQSHKTNYLFDDQYFPKREPYGWNNYPYDYYNIWVKHAGNNAYLKEPTLEMLTNEYNMIVFKHCFPVCDIEEDVDQPNIDSEKKTLENYKLQYMALKQKMLEFPNIKFLVWTGAAQVEDNISKEKAERAKLFFDWVREEWNTPGDNIYIWDFYELETEGTLYLKPNFASSRTNSHPNKSFAQKVYPLLCKRIVEVIENGK